MLPEQLVECEGKADGDPCRAPMEATGVCSDGACLATICGNGTEEAGEVCDDGNLTPFDGCSPDCRSKETCQNSVPDLPLEECDDGNASNYDGCSMTCDLEVPTWKPWVSEWSLRFYVRMVYDSARHKLVLFGGRNAADVELNDTWEFDGTIWTKRILPHSPPARAAHHLAYDRARNVTVLFGGSNDTTVFDDTWEYDGNDWVEKTPLQRPPPREVGMMTYHAGRQGTVLFGGSRDGAIVADTWIYKGSTWEPIGGAGPPAMVGAAMAYDPADAIAVLFGAATVDGKVVAQTWELPSTGAWNLISPSQSPRARIQHAMTYQAAGSSSTGTILMIGGANLECAGVCLDAWAYGNETWSAVSTPWAPVEGAVAFHERSDKVVLVGGIGPDSDIHDDVWLFDGSLWKRTAPTSPDRRYGCMMAPSPDGAGMLLFGGQYVPDLVGDTWRFHDDRWQHVAPATSPPPQYQSAMALDAARDRVVLFGAEGHWEFDGASWVQRLVGSGPTPRNFIAMAFDASRGQLVMVDSDAKTWAFDGTVWVEIVTAESPPARYGHSLVYDTARGVLVLFGGTQAAWSAPSDDTWELDGSTWSRRAIGAGPPARHSATMVYDETRRATLLFGGLGQGEVLLDDTWEYRDGTWTRLAIQGPSARRSSCGAYDPITQRTVVMGGSGAAVFRDIWFLRYE